MVKYVLLGEDSPVVGALDLGPQAEVEPDLQAPDPSVTLWGVVRPVGVDALQSPRVPPPSAPSVQDWSVGIGCRVDWCVDTLCRGTRRVLGGRSVGSLPLSVAVLESEGKRRQPTGRPYGGGWRDDAELDLPPRPSR